MTDDRERLRSEYATALMAHFGDRALVVARAQTADATGSALAEWTALAALLEARLDGTNDPRSVSRDRDSACSV